MKQKGVGEISLDLGWSLVASHSKGFSNALTIAFASLQGELHVIDT